MKSLSTHLPAAPLRQDALLPSSQPAGVVGEGLFRITRFKISVVRAERVVSQPKVNLPPRALAPIPGCTGSVEITRAAAPAMASALIMTAIGSDAAPRARIRDCLRPLGAQSPDGSAERSRRGAPAASE